MTIFEVFVSIGAGLVAGIINTLAGNGSAITLAVLLEFFGLPAHLANGTNRVGVLAQSAAAVLSFKKEGRLNTKQDRESILIPLLGAVLGIYLAIVISAEGFVNVYKYLLVAMLVVILVNPRRWLHQNPLEAKRSKSKWAWPIYFLLGVYAGFIQMGMGIIALAVFVLLGRKNLITANILKSVIIVVLTFMAVAVFYWKGMIHWGYGLTIGLGQMAGGWFTARFASRHSRAGLVAYYILILCILGAIYSVFFR
ncbi:MAG TPA: sulfite exporter TauE/SafE family protein [Membranihabitans sp.]|nr:sulfite exporter TauE/SafE family protein [Membranihabitans sp.]